jgi:hypothetical protein
VPEYFTLEELDALPNMSEGRYSTARKEAAAAYVVGIIEREVGTSFVSRTVAAEEHVGGRDYLVLRQPFARSITSATEDGAPVTDTLRVRGGVVRRYASSTSTSPLSWYGFLTVTYQAGYSTSPPPDVKEAALQATRWRLMSTNSNSDLNARQTSITNDMGGTVNFAVAGADRPTGYPDVDAVIVGWRNRLLVVKSA